MLYTLTIISLVSAVQCFWSSQNCIVSQWSSWASYSNGVTNRTRSILRYPIGTGKTCPPLIESFIDCQVSDWSNWHKSNDNKISRNRTILVQPSGSGNKCPSQMEEFYTADLKSMKAPEAAEKVILTGMLAFSIHSSSPAKASSVFSQDGVKTGDARDLLVIMDASGSVPLNLFTNATIQLSYLLKMLCPLPDPFDNTKPGFQQLALITFSNTVKEVFDFDTYRSLKAVQDAVKKAPYIGSMTCTAKAFDQALGMFNPNRGSRKGQPGVVQEVLIITDGQSNCGGDARAAAKAFKKSTGADVYGFMVGNFNDDDVAEVADYVSDPMAKHLFRVSNYVEFAKFVEFVEQKLNELTTPCAPFDFDRKK